MADVILCLRSMATLRTMAPGIYSRILSIDAHSLAHPKIFHLSLNGRRKHRSRGGGGEGHFASGIRYQHTAHDLRKIASSDVHEFVYHIFGRKHHDLSLTLWDIESFEHRPSFLRSTANISFSFTRPCETRTKRRR
jgi:hypothetical protein